MNRDYLGPTTEKPVDLPSPPAPATREAISRTKKERWFVFYDGSFFLHDTEGEAKDHAEHLFGCEEDEASRCGEWSEEVEFIYWGRVAGCVIEVERRPAVPGVDPDGLDEFVRYELVEVKGE